MTDTVITKETAAKIFDRIDRMVEPCVVNAGDSFETVMSQHPVASFKSCWNICRDITEVDPEILIDDPSWITALLSSHLSPDDIRSLKIKTLQQILRRSIPTSVILPSYSGHPCRLRIPPAIYDLLFVLLAVHYSIKKSPEMSATCKQTGTPLMLLTHRFLKRYFFLYVNMLALLDPKLWTEIKSVYIKAVQNEDLKLLFNNVFIIYGDTFEEIRNELAKHDTVIYATDSVHAMGAEAGSRSGSYLFLYNGLRALTEFAIKLRAKLGMPLTVYIEKLKEDKKEDPEMSVTLALLNDILKRSVVVNDDGLFTIDIDLVNDTFSYSPQGNTPQGQRPLVSKVEIRGKNLSRKNAAIGLPLSGDPDIQGIAYVVNPELAPNFRAIDKSAVLFDYINEATGGTAASVEEAPETPTPEIIAEPVLQDNPDERIINGIRYEKRVVEGLEFYAPCESVQPEYPEDEYDDDDDDDDNDDTDDDDDDDDDNDDDDDGLYEDYYEDEAREHTPDVLNGHFELRPEGYVFVSDD